MPSLFDYLKAPGDFIRNRFRRSAGSIFGAQLPGQAPPSVLSPELMPESLVPPQAPAPPIPVAPAGQPPPVSPPPAVPPVPEPGAPSPQVLGATATPASDIETFLGQIQGLPAEQKTLLGLGGETPEQKTQREGLQGSLERLISLRGQLETAQAPTEAMTSLDTLIAQQEQALRGFETSRFLADRPGIFDVGATQVGVAARAAREAEPITRALSDLLISRSVLGQQQQQRTAQIQAQIGGIQSEVELRQALAGLAAPGAKLPEGVQSKIFEKLLTPPKIEETFDTKVVGNSIVKIDKVTGKAENIFTADPGDDPLTTQQKFQNTFSLRKEYDDQSKNFITVRDFYSRMVAVSKEPSAAGDLALIFSYMKVLDPTSVVRETEFANAQNAVGVPDQVRNLWNKALTGERLTFNRGDFLQKGKEIYQSQLRDQQRLQGEFRSTAKDFSLDPLKVAPDLGAVVPSGISGETPEKVNEYLKAKGF